VSSQVFEDMKGPTTEAELGADRPWVSGASAGIQMVENIVAELAPTNIPILITGESGTGKEMFAHRIHRLSQRWSGSLAKVRCASVTPENLQTELALAAGNEGSADGGTILFDEIGDLDQACQRNLLCALPDGDTTRSGMLRSRMISTTSRNLEEEMRTGRFRSELYYRMAGVCLRLPALRDRKEDIPALVDFLLSKHSAEFGREPFALSAAAMQKLTDYGWPGNIRELENVIKKMVALGDERLAISEIEEKSAEANRTHPTSGNGSSLKAAARAASRVAERELILKALARTRWNRKRAAQDLQISYKSLLYKLKQIGVEETEAN
jgi:two-component system, NtrC family, response regulator AtoC